MNNDPSPSSVQLEALALLIAEKHMRESGQVPPTIFIASDSGVQEFRSEVLTDVASKDKMVQTARLLAIANKARGVTVLLECWARTASKPGGQLGDRQESVIIVTETRGDPRALLLRLDRNSKGRFVRFTKMDLPSLTSIAGRFAGLLSPKGPSAQDIHQAEVLLGMFGIKSDGSPIQILLN